MGKPWEDVPHIWKDEAAYCNWMRGQIRRMWSRHPIKVEYIKNRRVPISKVGAAIREQYPRAKYVCPCEMCHNWFPQSHMEVDHLHGGEGFRTYDEFLVWQKTMLFLGFNDIQHLCKPCHAKVTLSQKLGVPLSEVPLHQERIAFDKLAATTQARKLQHLGLPEGKNAAERKQIYLKYLQEKYNG